MRTHVELRGSARMVDLYVFGGPADSLAQTKDGQWVPYEPGSEPPVFFSVDEGTWRSFVHDWLTHGGNVDNDPLQDARAVRDRMINLVEKVIYDAVSPVIRERP